MSSRRWTRSRLLLGCGRRARGRLLTSCCRRARRRLFVSCICWASSRLLLSCGRRARLRLCMSCCRTGRTILCSLVRCSRLLGSHHSMTAKLGRLRSGRDCRLSLVHGRQERAVATGCLHVLSLQCRRRSVLLVRRCLFCLGRTSVNTTCAAVVTDPVHCRTVDDRRVVNVVNVGDVHVVHRTVVVKLSVLPTSAFIAGSTVAVTVVHATVEADLLAPVAAIPGVGVAAPAPITRSP